MWIKKPYKFNVKICEKNIKKSVDDKKSPCYYIKAFHETGM